MLHITRRCVQGLEDHYNSAQVQTYLDSVPFRHLYHNKLIYASGSLMKVHKLKAMVIYFIYLTS